MRTMDTSATDADATAPDTERGRPRRVTTYDGTTTVVTADAAADQIRRSLYRVDTAALANVAPGFRPEFTSAEVAQFHELGYVAMEGLLTPGEVASCTAALSDLVARRAELADRIWIQEEPFYQQGGVHPGAMDAEYRVRKLARFVGVDARLAAAAANPRLLSLLDQLVGPGHRLIQDMALMKPPLKGSEKPWHQDNAYFDWTPLEGILGVWIALDAATVDNGCMQIIPGSQRAGPAHHYHVRDCQLADQGVAVDRIEVVPLKPGGVLFFSGLIHHGTPANLSGSRRRALQFHYAAAQCRRMTFREHMAYFSDGAYYAGCRDWDMEAGVSRAMLEA
jgi:phytanoyl-CoA hydroxylase